MIGPIDLLHPSPALHFKTFEVFLKYDAGEGWGRSVGPIFPKTEILYIFEYLKKNC